MQKIDVLELVNILIIFGVVFILLGTTLELEEVIEDNVKKQEIIDRQADELIRCRAENENNYNELEKRYEKQE